jgi:hypothetical protein
MASLPTDNQANARKCRAFAEIEFKQGSIWLKVGDPGAAMLFPGMRPALIQQLLTTDTKQLTTLVSYVADGTTWYVKDGASGEPMLVLEPHGPDLFRLPTVEPCYLLPSAVVARLGPDQEVLGFKLASATVDEVRSGLQKPGVEVLQEATERTPVLRVAGAGLGIPGLKMANFVFGRGVLGAVNWTVNPGPEAGARFAKRREELGSRFIEYKHLDGLSIFQGPLLKVTLEYGQGGLLENWEAYYSRPSKDAGQ